MTEIAVELSEEDADRIAAIAESRNENSVSIVREAVANYLDYDAEFRAAVQQGIEEADRDEGIDMEDFAAEMQATITARRVAAKL